MHGVGGSRPNHNSLKLYNQMSSANVKEGQFRMMRNYSTPKLDIKIKQTNIHTCSTPSYVAPAPQVPWWMQALNLFGMFMPSETPAAPATPEENPLQKQLDEANAKIKELEAAQKEKTPEVEKEKETTEVQEDFKVEDDVKEEEITETTPDTVEEKTVKVNNQSRKISGNTYEGYTWTSLQNAYIADDGTPAPNSAAFRNAFRQAVLNGATDIGVGEQHYPKEFTFGGKTYKFNMDKYKPTQYTVDSGYGGTSAHTQAKTETKKGKTTTTKVYTGTAKATWTDSTGKTTTKSSQTTEKYKTADEARAAARTNLQEQVPEKHRSNVFFQTKAEK